MADFLSFFLQEDPAQRYALGASITLICVLISARFAFAFLRENARLFTALALLACSWMLVLGAYRITSDDELRLADLVTDIASFLFVYIGGLLVLDAKAKTLDQEATSADHSNAHSISTLQWLALVLLVFIAASKAIALPSQVLCDLGVRISIDKWKALGSELLAVAGAASLVIGALRFGNLYWFLAVAAIMLFYEGLGIARFIELWPTIGCTVPKCHPKMSLPFVYGFGIAKVLLTFTLGAMISYYGMPSFMRERGLWYCTKRFFSALWSDAGIVARNAG